MRDFEILQDWVINLLYILYLTLESHFLFSISEKEYSLYTESIKWWIFFFQVYIKLFLQMSQLIINDEHNGKKAKKWSVSTYRTEINLSGVELKT